MVNLRVISEHISLKGDEATKQREELFSLMIELDRDWYPESDEASSQDRIVKQMKKSVESSKYLGDHFKRLQFVLSISLVNCS